MRGGRVYVIAGVALDFEIMRLMQLNRQLAESPVVNKSFICTALGLAMAQMAIYRPFQIYKDTNGVCRARLKHESSRSQASVDDELVAANESLAVIGYRVIQEACSRRSAYIGQMDFPYQFCEVTSRAKAE